MTPILDGDHADVTFTGAAHPGARFSRGSYERCRFEKCTLTGARFVDARFTDCVFVGCELTTMGIDGTSFTNVTFSNCRAMGVNWTSAHQLTFSVSFDQCRLDNCVFGGMRLKGLSMVDCNLQGVDLSGCDLTGARFPKSDLRGALVHHAIVKNADFSQARDFAFDARTNKAGKTKVSLETAAQVLADLGLVVPDLDRLMGR
ncbi:MAG: pentapeptide repeat-containing protein [Pseudomonadota bacterium]|nr:pentapeptide repeat-containing protein [Pseudomonadota bacterium]